MLKSEFVMAPHPFLAGLCEHHLKLLAELAHRVHFRKGSFIFREGELANRFYLIQHGAISLESAGNDDHPTVVQTLSDGDVLGWSWLFAPYFWHFDARALAETDALFLPGQRLRELCETDRALGYEVMKRISHLVVQRLQATRLKLVSSEADTAPIPFP